MVDIIIPLESPKKDPLVYRPRAL